MKLKNEKKLIEDCKNCKFCSSLKEHIKNCIKEDNSPKRLLIEIYPSTTQKDIIKIIKNWKDVRTKQKELSKLPQRFIRSRPNNQINKVKPQKK